MITLDDFNEIWKASDIGKALLVVGLAA